ncbi:CBN-SPE-19 protein [Caenorhabditis brenneri]|uniref:CBN-SPE-19 protein n=1 Tax=Caenorhabditis brenneri TaxID=135651 RepID=G0N0Y4_CAEBE|nr:CBN-SPE-19 protein [Caenorhabditis brenneri]
MIQIFLLLLSISAKTLAKEVEERKSLECFTTRDVINQEIPNYTLEGKHTKSISYTEKDELNFGKPICVMFYGHNDTHSAAWQGHVSSFVLPLQCHMKSDLFTFCFPSSNQFPFLELSKGWACCCSYDKCNWNNPLFFQYFEQNILDPSDFLNKLKAISKASFCISFCVFVVVIETIVEVLCGRMCGKGKKKSYEMLEQLEEKEKMKKEALLSSPADPLLTPLLPPSLKVQMTQSSPARGSSKSYKPLSEMVVDPESLKVDKTQEDDPNFEEKLDKKSELEPASTQRGDDLDDIIPIPPKPEWKKTKTGRVQRTSMNYEESTYSDLQ